ncbi:DUF4231 domain-containing protein [Flammeovirga yaeyamensis]|uniref:DUF4231 domain-containing protein n=1 Tax=Flammeovirga yaeyamensis TaxID=367791 RepID=A0AAX1NAU9_9BACT|nr:DUF4231 domain-containing protein [Flammeovirga yaeyamensis]MBB3697730.1 hypothetical protein [Flammeovirga yaeyamensis]NMF35912.1 DUF4231 domain-containing protein [Flammeovirga yaeyamensis]QWG03138.1 DUF4231 domain-containing protein [Flammeovirga yaeyamensis]
MNSNQYIKERLDAQISWYDTKSIHNHKVYKSLCIIEIVAAAFVPFTSGIATGLETYVSLMFIITGILGISISIIAGILSLGKYQEKWIEYRTTSESLKKEKYLYLTENYPYNEDNSFRMLVQRIEGLISKENTNWSNYSYEEEKSEELQMNKI